MITFAARVFRHGTEKYYLSNRLTKEKTSSPKKWQTKEIFDKIYILNVFAILRNSHNNSSSAAQIDPKYAKYPFKW